MLYIVWQVLLIAHPPPTLSLYALLSDSGLLVEAEDASNPILQS